MNVDNQTYSNAGLPNVESSTQDISDTNIYKNMWNAETEGHKDTDSKLHVT